MNVRWPICDMYLSSFITGEFRMLAVITGEFRMLEVITGEFRMINFFHVLSKHKTFAKVQAGRTKDVFIWMKQYG